ncbi:MAG: RNA repair domain-containing protein [Sulfolobales archaeon]|nr:RNA repair domain-containing protein [Desulfurococcaceae archaeon]
MRVNTIRNELNKIYWSRNSELSRYSILVIDRLCEGGLREYRLEGNIKILNGVLVMDDTVIPFHRIVAILRDGEVIWRRNAYLKK